MKYIKLNILLLCLMVAVVTRAQTISFNDCQSEDLTLCEPDLRIQLPDNNKMFLGETNPNASSCSAHVRLQESVTSTCGIIVTFFVDYYPFDGADRIRLQDTSEAFTNASDIAQLTLDTKLYGTPGILLDGLPYNEDCPSDPGGFHRIVWTVINECGDIDSCSYLFRLEDCVPPMAEAVPAQMIEFPVSQEITISAQDFIENAIDDCSPVNWILYSWDDDIFRPIKVLNCDSIEENGGPAFEFDVWVADGGVDRDCNGTISWSERAKSNVSVLVFLDDDCAGELFDGTILSENGVPVSGVSVSLFGGPEVLTTETDEDGEYRLPEIDTTINYTVVPIKTTGVPDGISTLDLIKIQKHLLDIEKLSSPYKMIAADANNNSDISATDLLELRKVILRISSTLPNNTSWRFVPTTHVFADSTNPWPFPSSSNLSNLDFIGIKVGDVNETITGAHVPPEKYPVMIREDEVKAGDLVEIQVRSSASGRVNGLQGTLEFGSAELVNVLPGLLDMTLDDVAKHKAASTFSWYQGHAMQVYRETVLFTLVLRADDNAMLSELVGLTSRLTEAEIYLDENGEVTDYELALEFENQVQELQLTLHGANPIDNSSVVTVETPKDGFVTLWILDFSGRTMVKGRYLVENGQVVLGMPSLCREVPPGAYVLAVEQDGQFASMKIITGEY